MFEMNRSHTPTLSLPSSWVDGMVYVLGDIMLDRYVYGDVNRISPEAPVPILKFNNETSMLGGAANVARNIASLGGSVTLSGVIGQDDAADSISHHIANIPNLTSHLIKARDKNTTIKTRFVSGGHQILRVDNDHKACVSLSESEILIKQFQDAIKNVSVLVLSDYNKGLLSESLVERFISIAKEYSTPVIVDPKTNKVRHFSGASIITPNATEASLISGLDVVDDISAGEAAQRICDLSGVRSVVLTRGAAGMTVTERTSNKFTTVHLRTNAKEVYDVSGAGDTVIATLALAISCNSGVVDAAQIANVAAGVAVRKRGTAAVYIDELKAELELTGQKLSCKILGNSAVAELALDWRKKGLKVGFTNGCFDLLHPGHISTLENARKACDRLIVALNSDASVRRLKGEGRPVQTEMARTTVMASLECVDLVTVFDQDDPLEVIRQVKPDILIKGSDYREDEVIGGDVVKELGGEIIIVPTVRGHSTTSIIDRARAR